MSDLLKEIWASIGAYIWFICLAWLGGTANYISKVKNNRAMSFSIVELIGELVVSGFAGLITAILCKDLGASTELTMAAAGMAGHMGGRGLYLLEQFILGRFGISKTRNTKP